MINLTSSTFRNFHSLLKSEMGRPLQGVRLTLSAMDADTSQTEQISSGEEIKEIFVDENITGRRTINVTFKRLK